ncbi:hypothetical protein GGI25_002806 [Coemansia spiralis]|uniref:Uncharacterized protein n=2 Tax=Coemansia TaxID=4863 RepID=A0A9W8G7K5_9FUNG|nr:hypothetical protein BX070DRAFT_225121 [Coemansia spiralis]KAJ1989383.1 hypothetical protein EDC05_004712 [Coemansia umbellata]KAJ2622347.1 hypothetical protein GGI26_003358 [Coemansia sp. RSA 1358]KAJ2677854.1 hypothetical protein GGI25_002806 [Coemansia spiralis]
MEKEILRLYQERIDKYDEVFRHVSQELDQLKVSQRELTELHWDNNHLSAEVSELRSDIADLHSSLITERQNHLEVVAENDQLRIREHELERRVRVLANVSARYYKEQERAAPNEDYHASSISETQSPDAMARPYKRQRQRDSLHVDDDMSKEEYDKKQLEIDNETLQLSIETMRIQLQEQKANYKEIVEGLTSEFKTYREATTKENAEKARKIDSLEAELAKIKDLYRENLRDLIVARKEAQESRHNVKQESLLLRSEILTLQRRLDAEMEKSRFLQTATPSTGDHFSDA